MSLFVIQPDPFWPTTKLSAQKEVAAPGCNDVLLERWGIELNGVPSVRARADIDEHLNVVPRQQRKKVGNRLIRMPDREHHQGFGHDLDPWSKSPSNEPRK
jgi:hypothetical protein